MMSGYGKGCSLLFWVTEGPYGVEAVRFMLGDGFRLEGGDVVVWWVNWFESISLTIVPREGSLRDCS